MKKEAKQELHQLSLCLLTDNGIEFDCLSESSSHYRIGWWDCWLSTGKFWNRKTQQKGNGIDNLIFLIKNEKPQLEKTI